MQLSSLWRPEFGPEEKHFVSGNNQFFYFWGAAKPRWAGGGGQRPVGRSHEPKKTGARSAQARTRSQNPSVLIINLGSSVYHPVILSYSCHLSYIHLGSSVCHPVCHPVFHPVCHPVFHPVCHPVIVAEL
jgi:hypothetical protein